MDKKRRHHYVWQYYLSAWGADEKVWCLRGRKTFETSTLNIGQERDFYRVEELSSEDIEHIRVLAVQQSAGLLKKLNEGWIDTFQAIFKVRDALIDRGVPEDALKEVIDIAMNNMEEDFHSMIEQESIPYMEKLREGDVSFFGDDEHRMAFCHYLCMQYFRTKRIKVNVLKNLSELPQLASVNLDACWTIMRHVFATNMAFSVIADRSKFSPVILRPPSGIRFIAGDQPVINTHATLGTNNEIPNKTEFFYPVSPNAALLMSESESSDVEHNKGLSEDEVAAYNRAIFENSHEQIYAATEDDLAPFQLSA
ncbi:hypothetical protein T5B8_18858 [Salinisphaera sp. T5B8]|uniref:DUF4238 domain-containing protein n=1 Tax=Salinisphaera sp. T5B8 TaxID=1304154 RepID=UPI003340C32B